VDVQLLQPSPRHVLPSRSRLHPHLTEVDARGEVLCDSESILQIDHGVPPASRHEDGLAGVLHDLAHAECRAAWFPHFVLLDAREDLREVRDRWKSRRTRTEESVRQQKTNRERTALHSRRRAGAATEQALAFLDKKSSIHATCRKRNTDLRYPRPGDASDRPSRPSC
jgi:hypothetical protein